MSDSHEAAVDAIEELLNSPQQHPVTVTPEARIAATAIKEAARAMPTYGRRGEPPKFDGDDVVAFLIEYADSLITPSKPRRPRRP